MNQLSIQIEEKLFNRIKKLYSTYDWNAYKMSLLMLELELLEYYVLTGKEHHIQLKLIDLYAKMFEMRLKC